MLRFLVAAAFIIGTSLAASAADRREGYYYPPITSEEVFDRTIGTAPPAAGAVRTAFLTEINKGQRASRNKPRIAIFGKGGETQHMIIVALDDDIFSTLFRARAVMAQMSSQARTTPFFQKNRLQFAATWFDLAKLLGFKDIVLTDGKSWAHKVIIQ